MTSQVAFAYLFEIVSYVASCLLIAVYSETPPWILPIAIHNVLPGIFIPTSTTHSVGAPVPVSVAKRGRPPRSQIVYIANPPMPVGEPNGILAVARFPPICSIDISRLIMKPSRVIPIQIRKLFVGSIRIIQAIGFFVLNHDLMAAATCRNLDIEWSKHQKRCQK